MLNFDNLFIKYRFLIVVIILSFDYWSNALLCFLYDAYDFSNSRRILYIQNALSKFANKEGRNVKFFQKVARFPLFISFFALHTQSLDFATYAKHYI